jgi:hypothetical protein
VEVIRKSKSRVEYAETRRLISVCGINRELAVLRRGLNIAHEWKVIPSIPRIQARRVRGGLIRYSESGGTLQHHHEFKVCAPHERTA